jgi:starvation-inducible outer membrane lipoprotein
MKLSYIMVALVSVAIVGCATTPKPIEAPLPVPKVAEYKLKGYDGPEAMDKQEVLQASKKCIAAKMRPDVQYVSVRVDTGGKVLVPVDVQCEPY